MIDAYVWTTPNGFKLLIGLEELGIPYKTHWVDIMKGEQQKPEYLAINPNNKIPALVDSDGPGGKPLSVFESGATLIYLADKTGKLLAPTGPERYITIEWVFFNVGGTGPMVGQLGYYTKYGPDRIPSVTERFTKEVNRLIKVLDKRLAEAPYLAGDAYSIADVMNVTWARQAMNLGLDQTEYPNVMRWLGVVEARPAVQRALALKPA